MWEMQQCIDIIEMEENRKKNENFKAGVLDFFRKKMFWGCGCQDSKQTELP